MARICLLALLVTGALASSNASAAEYNVHALPEVGRCLKVAVGMGTYAGAACVTVAAEGFGKYEWTPVSEAEKQTFSGAGELTTLASLGHPAIKCSSVKLTGEYKGPKTATVAITLLGCTDSLGHQCQSSPTAKGEIATLSLEAELGFIKNFVKEGKRIVVVGLDLKPTSPLTDLVAYECGGLAESDRLEGSVIGQIKPINKMSTVLNLVYHTTTKGKQLTEKFEGGLKDTLMTTFTTGLESTAAPTTLNIKNELGHSAAALEIKATEK
jgi:hypothetical protein